MHETTYQHRSPICAIVSRFCTPIFLVSAEKEKSRECKCCMYMGARTGAVSIQSGKVVTPNRFNAERIALFSCSSKNTTPDTLLPRFRPIIGGLVKTKAGPLRLFKWVLRHTRHSTVWNCSLSIGANFSGCAGITSACLWYIQRVSNPKKRVSKKSRRTRLWRWGVSM